MWLSQVKKEKALQEEKISQGFLEQADMRTKSLVISVLKSFGYNDVVVEFY